MVAARVQLRGVVRMRADLLELPHPFPSLGPLPTMLVVRLQNVSNQRRFQSARDNISRVEDGGGGARAQRLRPELVRHQPFIENLLGFDSVASTTQLTLPKRLSDLGRPCPNVPKNFAPSSPPDSGACTAVSCPGLMPGEFLNGPCGRPSSPNASKTCEAGCGRPAAP
jgi:hypothetical protein